MYPAVTEDPATLLGELNNGTFGFEEKKVFGVEDGQRGVRFLGTVRNLAADGANENLFRRIISKVC